MDNVIDCSDTVSKTESVISLNPDQEKAFQLISNFLSQNTEYFFVLKGYAGTGKTYLMKALSKLLDRGGFVYCAPTNKATKVLRKTLGKASFNCKTIYSLLGIRMVADNEFLTLEFPNRPVDIRLWKLVILDEASMINKELLDYIIIQSKIFRVKFLFIGDPAQLPPIEEKESLVWTLACKEFTLDKVMRFDNELLVTATHIRKQIQKYPKGQVTLKSMHSANEGVWKFNREGWVKNVKRAAMAGLFSQIDHTTTVPISSNKGVHFCIEVSGINTGYGKDGNTFYPDWVVDYRTYLHTIILTNSRVYVYESDSPHLDMTKADRYKNVSNNTSCLSTDGLRHIQDAKSTALKLSRSNVPDEHKLPIWHYVTCSLTPQLTNVFRIVEVARSHSGYFDELKSISLLKPDLSNLFIS